MDLIERGEALRLIAEEQARSKYGMEDCALYRASKIVKELPAVDAVPVRHCRWIPKYQPPDPKASWSTEYYCSGCGHETHMTVMPDQRDNYIDDYCGGCGARMDGDAE